jgi:hypothetical protein
LIGGRARLANPIHGGAQVIDHHLGPFRCHELTDFSANTTTPTSDNSNFAFE